MEGVALLLLWALNKGIFGAKRIPKTDTCSSFKILQTCEDISFSITDLMLAVVCFAGFPEELQKHFFLLHLFLHQSFKSSDIFSFPELYNRTVYNVYLIFNKIGVIVLRSNLLTSTLTVHCVFAP